MFRMDGINRDSIVVDGSWGESSGVDPRVAAIPRIGTPEPTSRRSAAGQSFFGGEKEPLLQMIVNVGTFYSLTVPVERRAEVDALVAELEKARDRASS